MRYKGISDFIVHIAKIDSRLFEALKRIDDAFKKIYDFIENLIIPELFFERCKLRNTVNIATVNSTVTLMTFDTIIFDTDAMTVAANRITFRRAGCYEAGFTAAWGNSAVGARQFFIQKNGDANQIVASVVTPAISGSTIMAYGIFEVIEGDYIEAFALQSSGGNLDVLAAIGEYTLVFWSHIKSRS